MYEATTPDGKIYWVSDMPGNLFGSPIITYRLKQIALNGFDTAYPSAPVEIDLNNGGNVRFVLEGLYGDDVTFSNSAPPATEFFPPAEPGVVN